MNPYLSWAIMLIVAGALGWYYTNISKAKGKAAGRGSAEKSENIPSTKPKKKTRKTPEPAPALTKNLEEKPESPATYQNVDRDEEDMDIKEFAKRYAAVKTGVSTANHPKTRSNEQQSKHSTISLESSSGEFMGSHLSTSSTNGADADDDLSSAGSPVDNVASVADYMSDMLEPPAPSSSVFRLAGPPGSQPKKPKTQPFKQVETKKQRQQKAKNEARKLQVQEAEEQRRKLLEKQLHTAREAERQKAARTNTNPIPSVWKIQATDNASSGAQEAVLAQDSLLNTFDPSATTLSDQGEARPKFSAPGRDLPTEEEQLRILGALSSENDWTTVSSKKGKKKNGKTDESVSDASTSEIQDFVRPPVPHIPLPDPSGKGHPLDSDWVA
jgi:hypothetical protein